MGLVALGAKVINGLPAESIACRTSSKQKALFWFGNVSNQSVQGLGGRLKVQA
jgi:hypothetical protein